MTGRSHPLCRTVPYKPPSPEAPRRESLSVTTKTQAGAGVPIALCSGEGAHRPMLRIVVSVSAFAALLVTYWVHPTTAWIVLGSTFTLTVAFKVRQREEAEGALQATVDE